MTKKTLINVVLTGLESQRCYNDKKNTLIFFLQVYLCCGDQSLGKAVVSFQGLLNEQQNLASPTVIEGLFPLIAPGRSRQSSGAVDDSEPAVGVSVSLRQEQQETMGNVTSPPSPIVAAGGMGRQVNFACGL